MVNLIRNARLGLGIGGTHVDRNGFSGKSGKFPIERSAADIIKGLYQNQNSASSGGGYYISGGGSSPITYYDAPMAEKYKMSAATAYQEALANTAHQREVADLKAAGLNPVLGISGSGSSGVYGASLASSGSGGYGYGSYGSGKSTSDISSIAGGLLYGLPYFANGITNLIVTSKTGNTMSGYGAGMIAQNIISGALNLIKNFG